MGNKTINASIVDVCERQERELIQSDIQVDVAVVLPILEEETLSEVKMDLDYATIVKTVNEYINRNVIDARIETINYTLTIPDMPDTAVTQNLKEVLIGDKNEISTFKGNVKVKNDAINNDKVTKVFELSVEETVYIENVVEDKQLRKENGANHTNANNLIKKSLSTTDSKQTSMQSNAELVIKSADSKLYWTNAEPKLIIQNAPARKLYLENTSTENSNNPKQDVSINHSDSISVVKKLGDGLGAGMGVTETGVFKTTRVGDNGKVYTNPNARGNQYYKIVGNIKDMKSVKVLGNAGKLISFGATCAQVSEDVKQAETAVEQFKVVGRAGGEYVAGFIAGTAATFATSAVLVTVAGALGVATAPATIVIIAGCAIVAGIAASNAAEQPGREFGEKAGVKAMETWNVFSEKWNNHTKKK